MTYTIGQVAEKVGLTAHTLRYYDKEGLLPFVERTESGVRRFKESDFEWLQIIDCLKATGMPIKDIRQFVDWVIQGDSTLDKRYAMFLERRKEAQQQMKELQKTLDTIEYKCAYYKKALAEKEEAEVTM